MALGTNYKRIGRKQHLKLSIAIEYAGQGYNIEDSQRLARQCYNKMNAEEMVEFLTDLKKKRTN